jgi:transposase
MAARKKNAARLGAYLVFVDESGFLLIPTVLRTWAPRGRTPIHRHRYRRDKASVISGISLSPRRQRLSLFYRLHLTNIGQIEVCQFLRLLLRHLPGHVIVLFDNSSTHKGDPLRQLCQRHPRLHVEHFPSYAPELNPDEGVWTLAKRTLANSQPDDILELVVEVTQTMDELAESRPKLRACIEHSGLPPFLR